MNVSVDAMARVIEEELKSYGQEMTEGLKTEVRTVAEECRDELRAKSPKKTGKYRKSWQTKTAYEGPEDIRIIVHNGKRYRLTHLLEYGHAGPGGARKGSARPFPHITPAEQHAADRLEKKVKVMVRK